jgi:hypothetical protein
MKKIITLIVICIVFWNCSTRRNEKVIPYIVSIDAENSIYQTIKDLKQNGIVFYFENVEDKKFKIHLIQDEVDIYSFSNRKLFINDRFYPLVFDNDYKFFVKMENGYPIVSKFEDETERNSSVIKMPSIDERMKNKQLYIKDSKKNIIDWSTYWVVDERGNLLETNSKK